MKYKQYIFYLGWLKFLDTSILAQFLNKLVYFQLNNLISVNNTEKSEDQAAMTRYKSATFIEDCQVVFGK